MLFRKLGVITLILVGFALGAPAQEAPWERSANTSHGKNPIPEEERIDINRASVEELLKVPGMTPSWAGRIVRYRPYRSKMDLVDRGVLTAEFYERIRNYVIAHRVKVPEAKK